ncbi:MAG TPA: hypothetical protein VGL03_05645 [Thermoanaerobaculia bacterium]|jgi:hypothetical protein
MGAYNYGDTQPYLEGRRRPIPPPDDDCHCVAVQASPRILRPLVRRLIPARRIVVTEQSLHPEVNRLATSLLRLEETKSEYRTQVGIVLRVSFTGLERRGDDLEAGLRVSIDEREVFAGHLRVLGAYARGKVTFAHTVVGAVEMLYLHLLEMAGRNESSGALRLGVLHIEGSISNPGTIQDAVTRILRQNLQQQDDQCSPGPGFDTVPAYGLFPAAGFGYFYGFQGQLVDTPPEKGGPGTAR